MPHRMLVCHIPSIMLEIQALPLHLRAGNVSYLLLTSFIRIFLNSDFRIYNDCFSPLCFFVICCVGL